MSTVYYFSLPGITCINCVKPVLEALKLSKKALSIESVAEDIPEKIIAITVADTNSSQEEVSAKLRAVIESKFVRCENMGYVEQPNILSHLLKGIFGAAAGIVLMALMMSGVGIPVLVMYGLMGASALGTLYLGAESYYEAATKLSAKTLTMDTLFSISTLTVVGVSIASFFVPSLPMMMDAGLMIFGFRHIGKAIEESLNMRVLSGLKFKSRAPTRITKLNTDHTETEEDVDSIKVGDIIFVPSGEVIPLDGECLEDDTSVDTSILDGSITPKRIKRNEQIVAGMKVAEDAKGMRIKVTATSDDSYLASLDKKILLANAEKAPIVDKTAKILQYFIPAVLGVAIAAGITIGILINPALAIQCAATILVSACPCTLGLITPLSIKLGIAKGNENHIEFKNGKGLQAAAQIDTLVFDLNGTLTTGMPKVTRYKCLTKDLTSQEFLKLMASIEKTAQHPIAKAIQNFVIDKGINSDLSDEISDIDTSKHCGIAANYKGDRLIVGNRKMMQENGISLPDLNVNGAEQVIFLAKGGVILGYVCLMDPLRDDAKPSIAAAQKSGFQVHLLTGAEQSVAEYYAKETGIPLTNVQGNCIGNSDRNENSKTAYIQALKQKGRRVAMVGDRGNDTHALALSDCGFVMRHHETDKMSEDQAGAIIKNGKISSVLTAITIAKQTMRNITENLTMSLAYNSGLMILGGVAVAIGFTINPGLGVALMVLQTSLVLLNQYRFKKKSLEIQKQIEAAMQNTPEQEKTTESSYQNLYESGLTFGQSAKTESARSVSPTTRVHEAQENIASPHLSYDAATTASFRM